MRNPPLGPEIRELLKEGDHDSLRQLLDDFHPKDAASILTSVEPTEITEIMSLLPITMERDIFGYFEPELQEEVVLGSGRSRVKALLEALSSDDRAEFLDSLDDQVAEQLYPLLATAARADILRRQEFEDDQVGAIMSTEFCVLGDHLSANKAIEEIRRQAPSRETIYYSYVLDRLGKLKGFVSLRDLIMAKDQQTIGDIMNSVVVSAFVEDDQEEAARKIREYDLIALPVVDSENRLVGLITHDDAVDIIEEENTEDIMMMAGITPAATDESADYLQQSVFNHFRGRVLWLTILAVTMLPVAMVIASYEGDLDAAPKVVLAFLPLLLATGANVGGQASALVLRGLAVQSLDASSLFYVVWKELRVGLYLAATLGLVVFLLTFAFNSLAPEQSSSAHSSVVYTSAAITLAFALHIVTTALLGAMIPITVQRLGKNPEIFSHPALNAVADSAGVTIYLLTIFGLLSI